MVNSWLSLLKSERLPITIFRCCTRLCFSSSFAIRSGKAINRDAYPHGVLSKYPLVMLGCQWLLWLLCTDAPMPTTTPINLHSSWAAGLKHSEGAKSRNTASTAHRNLLRASNVLCGD